MPQDLIQETPDQSKQELSEKDSHDKLEVMKPKPYLTEQKLSGLKRGALEFEPIKLSYDYNHPTKLAKISESLSEISCQESQNMVFEERPLPELFD